MCYVQLLCSFVQVAGVYRQNMPGDFELPFIYLLFRYLLLDICSCSTGCVSAATGCFAGVCHDICSWRDQVALWDVQPVLCNMYCATYAVRLVLCNLCCVPRAVYLVLCILRCAASQTRNAGSVSRAFFVELGQQGFHTHRIYMCGWSPAN